MIHVSPRSVMCAKICTVSGYSEVSTNHIIAKVGDEYLLRLIANLITTSTDRMHRNMATTPKNK